MLYSRRSQTRCRSRPPGEDGGFRLPRGNGRSGLRQRGDIRDAVAEALPSRAPLGPMPLGMFRDALFPPERRVHGLYSLDPSRRHLSPAEDAELSVAEARRRTASELPQAARGDLRYYRGISVPGVDRPPVCVVLVGV